MVSALFITFGFSIIVVLDLMIVQRNSQTPTRLRLSSVIGSLGAHYLADALRNNQVKSLYYYHLPIVFF